jgi:hypothetical protein
MASIGSDEMVFIFSNLKNEGLVHCNTPALLLIN